MKTKTLQSTIPVVQSTVYTLPKSCIALIIQTLIASGKLASRLHTYSDFLSENHDIVPCFPTSSCGRDKPQLLNTVGQQFVEQIHYNLLCNYNECFLTLWSDCKF